VGQVEKGDLLVEDLGQDVDTDIELAGLAELNVLVAERLVRGLEQHDLGKDLVGEGAGHDERGVTGGTSEVDETALGEEDDVAAAGHEEAVDLGLDVGDGFGVLLEPRNVDFDVEVTDVADNGVVGHSLEVHASEDVTAAGGGDEDLALGSGLLHGGDLVAGDGGLESVDGVDLGDDDTGTHAVEGLGTALADVTETGDDSDLAGNHDIGGTLDAVDERLTAAVQVVELGLGDGVVDVDGGDEEALALEHAVEVVDTGGGLLGHAVAVLEHLGVLLVDQGSEVAAVVEDQVQVLAVLEGSELLLEAPLVLLLGLALPREDGHAGGGNGSGGVVLGGEDVARRPGELGTERLERLDEDGRLDGCAGSARVSLCSYNTTGGVLMCRQPAMRAPFKGWSAAYFSRVNIRPGISFSASSISRRPKAARLMSATFILWAGADMVAGVVCMGRRKGCGGG
jgi:hypothetical protein